MNIALLVMWMWAAQTVNGRQIQPGCRLEHIVTAEGTSINTQVCGDGNGEFQHVDPVDVPAVFVWQGDLSHFTCADKSRILLTSEDGAKHCVKFGGNR